MSFQAWDNSAAQTKALEKKGPVGLVRADGSHSGLMMTPTGEVRRAILKPKGKAARKQFKKLKRLARGLDPEKNAATLQAIGRQAFKLCSEGVAK